MFLGFKLADGVPNDVRELYGVAQASFCYGAFFCPLYKLASEQMYRVLEAALLHRCQQLDAPARIDSFAKALEWFSSKNQFSEKRLKQIDAARELRNMSSHATRQSIIDPSMALRGLEIATDLINTLFADAASE